MLLALAGVTGVGKSYYKDLLVEELKFEKIKIITTRQMRDGEKNNEDKIFVTPKELQKIRNKGEIAYEFEMLGNTYAYTKEELFSNRNTVFELHYNTIYDLKKICPNMCAIYILPKNLELAIRKLKERNLNEKVEKERILELEEHYKKIASDQTLRKMFDYTIYNNYDEESKQEIINLVKKIIKEEYAIAT